MWRFLPSVLLSKLRSPLKPVEQRVLGAVLERLEERSRDLLAQQIHSINLAQRNGRETRFYPIRGGEVSRPDRVALPNRREHVRLARIQLATPDGSVNADVYLSGGHLASMVFDSDPRQVHDPASARVTVTILADTLDVAPAPEFRTPADSEALPEWIVELGHRYPPLENRQQNTSSEERSRRLAELGITLPADYLELLNTSDGLRIGDVVVFGIETIQRIPLEDDDYGLVGEVAGKGSVAVSLRAPLGLRFFDHESEESSYLGGTLREALETLLDR